MGRRTWWLVTAWAALVVALAALTVWLVAGGTRGAEVANVLALPVAVLGGVVSGVAGRAARGPVAAPRVLLYDSDAEEVPFADWTSFAMGGVERAKFPGTGNEIGMRSTRREVVGVNKSFRTTRGSVTFEYRVADFDTVARQVYFAVIPMQETGLDRSGLIEVGTSVQDHPDNATSVYRQRFFVPREHYLDGGWHSATIDFDFTPLHDAFYAIFGPRINEGVPTPGDATVYVRHVRVWSTAP